MTSFILQRRKPLLFFCAYVAFILIALALKEGDLFYEGGMYKYYVTSMFQDFDFNVYNQAQSAQRWLIGPGYYLPDIHTEIQTPFLIPFYAVERGLGLLVSQPEDYWFTLSLGALTFSFLCLFLAYTYLKDAALNFGIELKESHYLWLFAGSTLSYFTVFTTTVLEIFALPFLSYILLEFSRFRTGKELASYLLTGISAGILLIAKISFVPLPLYFIFLLGVRLFRRRDVRNFLCLFLPVIIFQFARLANHQVKFGSFINPLDIAGAYVTSFHPMDIAIKIGMHLTRGPFIVSPIMLLATIFTVRFLNRCYRKKIFTAFDLLVITTWVILGTAVLTFTLGATGEDHLPGRMYLSGLPILALGFADFLGTKFSRKSFVLLSLLSVWYVLTMAGYVLIASVDVANYARHFLPTGELLPKALHEYGLLVMRNFRTLRSNWILISLFVGIIGSVILFVPTAAIRKSWEKYLPAAAVLFLLMTGLNISIGQKNAEIAFRIHGFPGAVIGAGAEIQMIDYILDYLRTVELGTEDARVKAEVRNRIEAYYKKVETQVIRSTPEFDEAIRNRSPLHSFWIRK